MTEKELINLLNKMRNESCVEIEQNSNIIKFDGESYHYGFARGVIYAINEIKQYILEGKE